MKNWTIGKRITFGFAAILIILLALGIFIRTRLTVVQSGTTTVTKASIPSLELLADAKARARDVQATVYRHIYSTSAADMEQLEAEISADVSNASKDLEEFEKLASPQAKVLLDEVKARREPYRAMRGQVLTESRAATNAAASALVYEKTRKELDPLTFAYEDAFTKCEDQVKKESGESADSVLAAVNSSNWGVVVGALAGLVLGIGLALVIIRSTTRVLHDVGMSLSDSSDQTAAAAAQVSSASQTLAQGAGEQASSLEETSSSLEEMTSMTKRNAENAQKVNELAKQARQAADKGATDMRTMNQAMEAIKVSSDDIAKIIKTIDEIAFQTNILALNAAVEAARAGDAGMGFAVVADEVRNLAQRSAQAAKETAAKIEGAIGKTALGVEISSKVAQNLNEIVTKAHQVDELAAEVAGASREQTQGIGQINAAVGQMDKVTQSNAASAEESAAAAEELNAQAGVMKQAVGELVQLVGGISRTPARNAGPRRAANPQAGTGVSAAPVPMPGINGNGNGHGPGNGKPAKSKNQAPAADKPEPAARRDSIPLEAGFRDF